MKKIWEYGTSTPIQRVGLILLSIGMLSYLSWIFTGYHHGYDYTDPDPWINVIFDPDYFPRKRDFIFFHLYLYLIPLGLLMTWGYGLLIKLKNWVLGENKTKSTNTEILHFKNNEAAFETLCWWGIRVVSFEKIRLRMTVFGLKVACWWNGVLGGKLLSQLCGYLNQDLVSLSPGLVWKNQSLG